MRSQCLLVLCLVMGWFNTLGAFDCSVDNLVHKTTCDDCIKCGGIWCKNLNEPVKCAGVTSAGDSWCPGDRMEYEDVPWNPRDGLVFQPQYDDTLAEINSEKNIQINVDFSHRQFINKAHAEILNTTQPSGRSKVHVTLVKKSDHVSVTTKVKAGFCSSTSALFEYVFVGVRLEGVEERGVLKYHVQCQCGCSEKRVEAAPACHGRGALVCGACQCEPGRIGKFCECGQPSSSCIDGSTEVCSGNGHCDQCKTCQCNERANVAIGSEHYDPEDNCKNIIISTVNNFFACTKQIEAPCGECDYDIIFQKWNETLLNDSGAGVWWAQIKADSPYWATRKDGKVYIMRKPASQC